MVHFSVGDDLCEQLQGGLVVAGFFSSAAVCLDKAIVRQNSSLPGCLFNHKLRDTDRLLIGCSLKVLVGLTATSFNCLCSADMWLILIRSRERERERSSRQEG